MDMIESHAISRPRILQSGAALILALLLTGNLLHAQGAGSKNAWVPLKITDIDAMEWDDRFRMGNVGTSQGKLLYRNDEGAFMFYVAFSPGWDAINKDRHYHNFHEWGFVLEGDFMLYEFVSPVQEKGSLVHMRAGTWMDRPAYSIHGNRSEVMERQQIPPPSLHLAFAEGGKNIALDPESPMYSDEWKDVEQFNNAHFRHTARPDEMEWETDPELPGASVKWLSDDWQGGFRSVIRYVPPGWSHPDAPQRTYFKKAQRFYFFLYGDLKVATFDDPGDSGESVVVKKDFFLDRPAMSIWGWPEGTLSETGAQWLEVTYAEGTRVGRGPIEQPSTLP